MWFSLELGWNWSVKLCYSFILSVWEMERALNLKPSLPWGIDAFWNLIYAVCFLQLKKTTKQNRTTTTKPPFCAWFSYKTKIKNPKPLFLPPQLCAASSKRVPPKHIVLFRFVLCYSWLSTSLGLVDYVFVLLTCQSAFYHLPWVINLCCWLDVCMETVDCLHRTLLRQKLLKQSGGVHERGIWKVKVNILTHATSFSSSIISNGSRYFSSAAEGVFALLETQGKGKLLLGNRNQCKDSCREVQPLLYVKKKLTVECFAIAVWFFVSCTWSALI